jgi:hypothetical protein
LQPGQPLKFSRAAQRLRRFLLPFPPVAAERTQKPTKDKPLNFHHLNRLQTQNADVPAL